LLLKAPGYLGRVANPLNPLTPVSKNGKLIKWIMKVAVVVVVVVQCHVAGSRLQSTVAGGATESRDQSSSEQTRPATNSQESRCMESPAGCVVKVGATQHLICCINTIILWTLTLECGSVAEWLGSGLLINRSRARILVTPLSGATLGKLFTHMSLVIKQYNLVPANGR